VADDIKVEVVFAAPECQRLVTLTLRPNATVNEAIEKSGLARQFPQENLSGCEVGIWGRVVTRDKALHTGDRVEIYRRLALDPREARRRLAAAGRTMASPKKP